MWKLIAVILSSWSKNSANTFWQTRARQTVCPAFNGGGWEAMELASGRTGLKQRWKDLLSAEKLNALKCKEESQFTGRFSPLQRT